MKRALLERIFREAVKDCHAGKLVRGLPELPFDVLACGKAAREMADSAGGNALVVTPKHGEGAAGHPVPNARSAAAGRAALRAAAQAKSPVVLISGGASALWCVPAPGLTLADKIEATRALVASGADIHAINCVRKHLSAIKGGRLAAAVSAPSLTCLLLSDVLGDDPSVIGSGPCVPDPSTLAEANAIARAVPNFPPRVLEFLAREATETPKHLSVAANLIVIGNHETLRQAAVRAAARAGCAAQLLPPAGDDVGACEARLAALAPGPLYIGGGEPTVRVRGSGKGGRCQQLALAMARRIRGTEKVFLAAGSDGTDGPTEVAGAIVDGTTWDEAERRGFEPARALDDNDSHRVHALLGTHITTGPTGTNLLDLHLFA
jgi:glycerate 2-kinase